MSAAEIEAGGVLLAGWLVLTGYLVICLVPFAEPIERAVRRGWRIAVIAWGLRRDVVLRYDWRRAFRVAGRLA